MENSENRLGEKIGKQGRGKTENMMVEKNRKIEWTKEKQKIGWVKQLENRVSEKIRKQGG